MNWKIPLQIGVFLLVASTVTAANCPSFFTENDCLTRKCLNGGYLDKGNTFCICPAGYLGIHCEAVKTSMPPDNHFKAGGTSFNIMNVNLYTQYWGVKTYANIQQGVQKHFAAFPGGYDKYNLVETTGKPELTLGAPDNTTYSFNDTVSTNTSFNLSPVTDTGLYWCYEVPIYENLVKMIQTGLKNTAITILTQHPPSNDKYEQARAIAVAFGIRINVLWIIDKTFNRCTDAQVNSFTKFVRETGGLFVQLQSEEGDQPTIDLVTQVLLTHYKPQYVTIQDCSATSTIPLVIDPTVNGSYNFVLLGNNVNPSPDTFRNCLLRQPLRSKDNMLAIFQSPDPICSNMTINANGGECTAIVFANAGSLDLTIYTTYVEDQSVDASRYAIVEGVPFYPAVHIESNSNASITLNSISFDNEWSVAPIQRYLAAFEWVSDKTVTCDSSKTSSLYLKITVGTTTIQRSVLVACVAVPPPPTSAPVISTSSAPSTSKASTTAQALSTASISSSTYMSTSSASTISPTACSYNKNYATFLFAYAADFDPTTYSVVSLTIGNFIASNSFPNKQTLANKVIDLSTSKNITYTTVPLNFTTNCVVDQPNATLRADDRTPSDALDAIREFLNGSDTTRPLEGSLIIILVNRLPSNDLSNYDLTDDEYDQLTNLNVKVFPIISISSLAEGAHGDRGGAVFNKLAAQTNGHYVVASTSNGQNPDFNRIVANFMKTAYKQNLLFTRNLGANRLGTDIGVVRIPKSATGESKVNVTITVSLSAVDAHKPQPPTRLFLGIKPNGNNTQTVSIDFLALPDAFTNSNYYTTTVQLAAGIDRELFLAYNPGADNNDLMIRMWAEGDAERNATFMKYNETTDPTLSSTTKIDENIGAALQVSLQNQCFSDLSATLLITDCNGVVSAKYDSDQMYKNYNSTSGFYQFIPFFCSSTPSSATCISGAESKYDAQFVSDSFSFTQSFQCRLPDTGPIDSCKLTDANGNNQCSGTSPFKRGPQANLYDCSNHGYLQFNETTNLFRCECDNGFTGDSCEIVNCDVPNQDPLATDNNYHTYTVVVGLEKSNGFLVLDDAQILFGLGSISNLSSVSVWKYQLLTICGNGTYDMIFSGSDLREFQRLFLTPNYLNIAKSCQEPAKEGAHDLTAIYKQSVKGIGRNVKGIIVYYSAVSKMINVTLDDFIVASQPYQQQLFVYALDETDIVPLTNGDSIAQAAMSTGGFLIQSFLVDTPTDHIDETFMPALLQSSSSIAWMSTVQNGNFLVSTVNQSTKSYLLSWKAGQNLQNSNPKFSTECKSSAETSVMCRLKGKTNIAGNIASGPFYVAVYSLNDALVPKAQIISALDSDTSDAVSTSTSDARTLIAINIPSTYNVTANEGDGGITRNAKRTNCTFDWTAYSVFSTKKYQTGTNIAKITIQGPDGTYTRFFPFGTTSAPVCQNGGTPVISTGSCSCPSGFQGPDCSLVNCLENSAANAWSDVCVCAKIDDDTCAKQYTHVF